MTVRINTVETEMHLDGESPPEREERAAVDPELEREKLRRMVAQAIKEELDRIERRQG